MKNHVGRGVSLVEVLVVVGVLGILLSVAAPSFSDMLNRRRVQAAAAEIATDLAFARSQAGLRNQQVFLDFKANDDTSCYTIQTYANSMDCDCTLGPGLACPASFFGPSPEMKTMQVARATGVRFTSSSSTWTPSTTPQRVAFEPLHMLSSLANFAVTVEGGSSTLKVQMNLLGRVSTCSPSGAFGGGVPAC